MSAAFPRIELYDTTLRDGVGGEGISFSKDDKISILKLLLDFGADFIEGGMPCSNPKDSEFFAEAAARGLAEKLVAFSPTAHKSLAAADDPSLGALVAAGTRYVCVFGKADKEQAETVLSVSPEQNVKIIADTVSFLRAAGKSVIFDAEHFFDGFFKDEEYALAVLKAAQKAGAERIVLCDTNGGSLPEAVFAAATAARKALDSSTVLGVHCHNDNGFATANTYAALRAGATHVQGTFIGFGERCGNTNLSCLVGNMAKISPSSLAVKYADSTRVARAIAETANISLPKNMPFVGKSAFAHKAGMHADAILKTPRAFEHIDPSVIGNRRRFLMSEIAGRATVTEKLASAYSLRKYSDETGEILKKVKEMENLGYQYESAEASFVLLAEKVVGNYKPAFALKRATASTTLGENATAEVSVLVGDKEYSAQGSGNGPVDALDTALRKALTPCIPEVASVCLKDYKVRVINPENATRAKVRVLITSSDGTTDWTTIGVSTDVIEASWIALSDSIDYLLCKKNLHSTGERP